MSNESIKIYPELRYEREILVASRDDADVERRNHIAFLDYAGRVSRSCFVPVVTLDLSIQDFSQIGRGLCGGYKNSALSKLAVGSDEIIYLPERYIEFGTSPSSVLGFRSVVGERQVEIRGISEGAASLVRIGDDTSDHSVKGVCPVIITETSK